MKYRWYTIAAGRESGYVWLKLGPVAILCGRILAHCFCFELNVYNHLVWASYFQRKG